MLNGVFELIGFGLFGGGHVRVGEPLGRIHFLAVAGFRLERGGGAALLATQLVVAGVSDGAHEPRLEGAAAKRGYAAEGGDECFLSGVFCQVGTRRGQVYE